MKQKLEGEDWRNAREVFRGITPEKDIHGRST
jgi:hypothetical protein